MKNNWLNDIHDRMSDYEVDEPHGLWEGICSAEAKEESSVSSERNIGIKPWIWGAAAAACLLLLWNLLPEQAVVQQPSVSIVEPLVDNTSIPQTTYPDNNVTIIEKTAKVVAQVKKSFSEYSAESLILTDSINIISEENKQDVSDKQVKGTQKILEKKWNEQKENHHYAAKLNKKESNLIIGLSTSGGAGLSNSQFYQGGYFTEGATLTDLEWVDSPMLGIMDLNRGMETSKKVTHHSPFRTGVSVSYKIKNRWSVGCGISYALVSSDMQEGSVTNYIKENQILHYIGMPISLSYRIFTWKKFDLYLSPDILAEQCINGKTEMKYIINGKLQKEENKIIESRPLQLSSGVKLGAQYNLNSLMSIYVEPGCRYYFDDRSSLETVFKEKSIDVNLNMGLRFTLGK